MGPKCYLDAGAQREVEEALEGESLENPSVKELLKRGATVILLGPGGVGKTTVAAALGIAGARAGFDTGMITVDPARRLRDALGLERLTAQPTPIDARRLASAGLDRGLKLSAMVLDVKGAWDSLIERFVKPPAARASILKNPFYRSLTEQFAGAEAYAALEQLYDMHCAARFEVEVVDTPPAAHAFEFLQAPAHLIRLLDSRAARWLFIPYAAASKATFGIAGRAARFIVGRLEEFAGMRTLTSISEFFGAAAEAADSIADRFRKVDAMLHSASVHFVLVTTIEEDRLREAHALVQQMESAHLRLAAIVLNRTLDEATFDALLAAPDRFPAASRRDPCAAREIFPMARRAARRRSPAKQPTDGPRSGFDHRFSRGLRRQSARRDRTGGPVRPRTAAAGRAGDSARDRHRRERFADTGESRRDPLQETGAGRTFLANAEAAFGITASTLAPKIKTAARRRAARNR